jgi:hypothetical protein
MFIVATPLAAHAQTKDLSNDLAPSTTEIINQSEPVAALDPGPGFKPFQTTVTFTQQQLVNVSTVNLVTVPAGKRLVIEFVTVTAQVPPGQRIAAFNLFAGAGIYSLLVNEQPTTVSGDAIFRAAQQLRLYADPNTQVQMFIARSSTAGIGQYQVALSGYFEDAN